MPTFLRNKLCLLLVCYTSLLTAQPHYFKKYGVEKGLSYNSIFTILQDTQDFLWFGTRDGLNRFDGYTFKTFRNNPRDPASIGNNFIYSLFQGRGDTIWVGTQNGLYLYHSSTESFELLKGTAGKGIRDVKMDQAGTLWYIADFTLCALDLDTKRKHIFAAEKYFQATSIAFTADRHLWVATNNGYLQHLKPSSDKFEAFYVFDGIAPHISRRIERLTVSPKYGLLVSTAAGGVKLFDPVNKGHRTIMGPVVDQEQLYARDAVFKKEDECWIASETGIYIYHFDTGLYEHLKKNDSDPFAISDNAVHALLKDKEEGIWIGTYFGGLNYSSPQQNIFEKFYPNATPNSLNGSRVREIKQAMGGELWIGTEDAGLYRFNPRTHAFRSYDTSPKLPSSNIHALMQRKQELWIGTYEHGLVVVDLTSNRIKRHYLAGINGFNSNFIVTLYACQDGNVFMGTSIGLYRYNAANDRFQIVQGLPSDIFVSAISQTHDGSLWVGTRNRGLFRWSAKTQEFVNYEPTNTRHRLHSNIITAIYETNDGQLFLTTENGGVERFLPDTDTFEIVKTETALPSSFAFSMLEDNEQHLWISTAKGLVKLSPKTGKMTQYTAQNGLLNDQFNYNSAFRDAMGTLYFGSVMGLVRFNPKAVAVQEQNHKLYITGFQIFNQELAIGTASPLKKSITQTKDILLAHDQSTFSIDFASLCYTTPEMTQYQYQMKGLDTAWTHLQTNRKVYFTKLQPGDYTFKVRATGHDNSWKVEPTILHIRIKPPLWATPSARICYFLLTFLIGYLIVKRYHQYLEHKNSRKLALLEIEKEKQIALLEKEKEKEIYHAKREFFTHITHEIKTPLTLIRAPLEKAKKSTDLTEIKAHLNIVEKNSNHLIHMANQLLDLEKTEATEIPLHFVKTDVEQLLNKIYERFSLEVAHRELKVAWYIEHKPFNAYVDAEALSTIVGNLLSNAIKFADKLLKIVLMSEEDRLVIRIENDGAEIPTNKRDRIFDPFFKLESDRNSFGTGIGLPLAKSLTELHHGQLIFDVMDGRNTFAICLPIHYDQQFESMQDAADDTVEDVLPDPKSLKPLILLIDDHKDILDFIGRELRAHFDLVKAGNGQEALTILVQQPVALIISDVMMPVMDGFEFCQEVKTNINFSHIPFILLTAKDRLSAKIKGLEIGADVYMEKPFSMEHLFAQINSLLLNRNHMQRHFVQSPFAQISTLASSKTDELFLKKLHAIIHQHLDNPAFEVDQLASELCMSRSSLFRKIKSISNLTPNEMIVITRLKQAAALLMQPGVRVYEVAEQTGFSSAIVFARVFHKQFGISPKIYAKQQQKKS